MKEVEDYLVHAKQCREIAQRALPEHREPLEQIAKTWEMLAAQRLKELKG